MNPVLELKSVHCTFGRQTVLRDLNLVIRHGETVAIVGESGCGKSVTMKVLMKLIEPTSGTLRWFDHDVSGLTASERGRLQRKLGYLFQGAALFDSLSIFENVAFGLRQSGVTSEALIRQTVVERLDEVGLNTDILHKRPSEISGGMQKRVGLARALALSPDVMFYDEPTTGLDPLNCRRIDDLILAVRDRRNVTGVIVTHDLRTIRRVADRVIMMVPGSRLGPDESQIVFDGTWREFTRSRHPLVMEYIGEDAIESCGVAVSSGGSVDIRAA